jgi:hypothetical protein
MLTEKRDKGPPVVAQKAVRWVDAQARYSTPSTSTNLTAMKCCCWGSYMGETMRACLRPPRGSGPHYAQLEKA